MTVKEYIAKQTAFNDRQATAIDSAAGSVSGLTDDIKTLNDKIAELQNSAGQVTAEDEALINELETQGNALVVKAEAAAEALKALDGQTPPTPPAPPA